MIFKVGQLVQVKPNANKIPGFNWAPSMDKYLGAIDRIEGIKAHNIYTLEKAYSPGMNDDGFWRFLDSWLVPLEEYDTVTNDEPENPISDDELMDLLEGEL